MSEKIEKLWGKLPRWLQNTILIVCAIIGIVEISPLFNDLFRSNILPFFVIWIAIPLLLAIFKWSSLSRKLNHSNAVRLRNIAVGITIFLSFTFLFRYDLIRDSFGYNYIKGYQSEYYPDVDDYGRDQTGVIIHTDKWYTRFMLWLGEWGYLFLIFGVPFMTWQLGDRLVSVLVKSQNKVEL